MRRISITTSSSRSRTGAWMSRSAAVAGVRVRARGAAHERAPSTAASRSPTSRNWMSITNTR